MKSHSSKRLQCNYDPGIHYFLLNGNIVDTITYVGPLPAYEFFDP
jgi:hypothetical protein